MRQTAINNMTNVGAVTGLDKINDALRYTAQAASEIDRAPKIVIDPKNHSEAMRNFTKILDSLFARETKTYALVEYVDDAQVGDDE